MMRRRSAAGASPVSLRTSREKWNSDAWLLRAISPTSVLSASTTASSSSLSRSRCDRSLTVVEYASRRPREGHDNSCSGAGHIVLADD